MIFSISSSWCIFFHGTPMLAKRCTSAAFGFCASILKIWSRYLTVHTADVWPLWKQKPETSPRCKTSQSNTKTHKTWCIFIYVYIYTVYTAHIYSSSISLQKICVNLPTIFFGLIFLSSPSPCIWFCQRLFRWAPSHKEFRVHWAIGHFAPEWNRFFSAW